MRTLIELFQLAESTNPSDKWIQIMRTGKWKHPKHGDMQITEDDLREFAENFKQHVRGVDLGVDISHKSEEGAVGWFKDVKVDGDKLMARVNWTEEGQKLVTSGKFRYFSPEFAYRWTDPANSKTYRNVLFGGALTNRPFLKDMQPIALSETEILNDDVLWFADDYDPDHDHDDDSTTNPKLNPDWKKDIKMGITPWSKATAAQQKEMESEGMTKEACDKAHAEFMKKHPHLKLSEDHVINSRKSPPKGYPQDRSQYADPANYKYPIDKGHIDHDVSYFNQGGQQKAGGYSDEQWASIGRKIAEAANKLIGPGHSFKDGKIETGTKKLDDMTGDDSANPDDGTSKSKPTDDVDSGKFSETHNNPDGRGADMTITLEEFNAQKEKIRLLEEQNRRHELSEKVRGYMFSEDNQSGKIPPALQEKTVDLMMTMSDDQVTKFDEFVQGLPAAIDFSEQGANVRGRSGKQDNEKDVVKLTEQYEKDGMSYKEAFIKASEEVEARS